MKKHIISAALALSLLLTLFPAEVLAAELGDAPGDAGIMPYADGADGDLITYEISAESNTSITVDVSTGALTKCTPGSATAIDIPEAIPVESEIGEIRITNIGDNAFASCREVTGITIPDSVTNIGEYSFSDCNSLLDITIPNSVLSIGRNAFSNCSRLNSITIPDSVSHIGRDAFYGCYSLASIAIPDGVTSIENYTFYGCSGLDSITIPDSVTAIKSYAFYGCHSLTNVTLPEYLTDLGDAAFGDCRSLSSISIPDGISNIKRDTFLNCCNLFSVEIPVNVINIGYRAFSGCNSLNNVTIPDSVTTIEDNAFSSCSNLTGVKLSNSVTSIGNYAFQNCSSLTSIVIPNSVTSIGDSAFRDCSGLTNITIPNSITSISRYVFSNCTSLTSVTIPDSVTSIGNGSFYNCRLLSDIIIPNSVTKMGEDVFEYCSSLISVTIPNSVTSIGRGSFRGCVNLKSITIPESITNIEYTMFFGCSSLTSITIPNSVTSIGDEVFSNCKALIDITIPDSVTSIGNYAFSNCSGLTSITIPNSITSIGYEAFRGCSGLTSIIIPDSVTSIGNYAFSGVNSNFILYCYPESHAETYAKANNLNYQLIGLSSRTLSVSVLDENGFALSEGFTVTWYDENGNSIGTSTALSGADPAKSYSFAVELKDGLAASYDQPERQTIAPTDAANREIRLVKKAVAKTLRLIGQVNEQSGTPLSGVTVTVTQAEGDTVETVTSADGTFAVTLSYGVASITIQKDGYYIKRETLNLTDETKDSYDAGIYTIIPVQTVTDRLTLSVTQRRAAEEQAMALEMPLSSLGNLEVMLIGSDGRSISDFDVQGFNLLFQPGAVSPNETISITLTDASGVYRTASTAVTLDGDRLGTAELTMVQKGSFVLGGVSGPDANLLVFDSAGTCIQTSAAVPGLTSDAMEPGMYQVVLLQKSELLRSASSLSYLNTFGLAAGRDYLLREVTVVDGEITRLDNCVVPTLDESRISYTIAGSTSVTSSKPSGIAVGELLMVRAAYDMDITRGVSANSLHIVLPDGISLLEASVLINNSTAPYTYDQAAREVCVNMNGRDKAVVWLCCTPVKSGSHSIGAFLKLTNGSSQPIGATVVLAEDARLNVPERTGKAEGLTASGKARPNSIVTLYDNDMEVGCTTANAAGSWSMSFNLVQPVYSYSYHNIHAVVIGGNLTEPISTESVLVTYDKRLNVELEKITMYNTGDHGAQETVFDFTNSASTSTPYYRMWPSTYPTFTFKVEFSGDSSKLEEVHVVTANSAGDETYVKTTYDPVNGAWIGTHNYTSFGDAPVMVTAAYNIKDIMEVPYDKEISEDFEKMFIEVSKEIEEILSPLLSESLELTDLVEGTSFIAGTIACKNSATQEIVELGTYRAESGAIEPDVNVEILVNRGYVTVDGASELIWAKIDYTETSIVESYIDLGDRISLTLTTSIDIPTNSEGAVEKNRKTSSSQLVLNNMQIMSLMINSPQSLISLINNFKRDETQDSIETLKNLLLYLSILDCMGKLPDSAGLNWALLTADVYADVLETNNNYSNILDQFNGMYTELLKDYHTALSDLLETCSDGTPRISNDKYITFRSELQVLEGLITDFRNGTQTLIFWGGLFSAAGTVISSGFKGLILLQNPKIGGKLLSGTSVVNALYSNWAKDKNFVYWNMVYDFNRLDGRLIDLSTKIIDSYIPCDSNVQKRNETHMLQPIGLPVTYIADPSGYVYEAVPFNRLSGVTAVISSEVGGTWNAVDYNQINPQTTGLDGGFYWDVPQGNWKVSFTKDGYKDTDTSNATATVDGWLPVPPPQLDINVGMVSTASPAVTQTAAYRDRVEVAFSQYMDIDSVKSALTLTQNEAILGECTVTPLDAEYNLENTVQYATRFAIAPSNGELTGELTVSVNGTAQNYAGTQMTGPYTSPAMTVAVRPTGIDAPETISIIPHKEAAVTAVLRPGIAGQELIIDNLSPALLAIDNPAITTGADGSVRIALTGILPGSGVIRISDPVSGLSKTVDVHVGAVEEVPPVVSVAPVTAVLEDGTAVTSGMTIPSGAKIWLQTQTADAVIRYTLNDTCPCEETANVYQTPIVITADTVLRAAAYKDGTYSSTIRLELKAAAPSHAHNWAGAWSNDASSHWHECTADGCDITSNSDKNGYGAHVYDDDADTTCDTCGYVRTVTPPVPGHTHNWSETWNNDANSHWHECTADGCDVTSNKSEYGAHVYDDDMDTTCNTCGHVRTVTHPVPGHTHNWAGTWSSDATNHWHECTADGCDVISNSNKSEYGAHVYDDDADTICNTCGYVRTVAMPVPDHTHNWAGAWSSDANGHWHNCTAENCPITTSSQKDGYAAHTSDNGKVTAMATAYQNGTRIYSCTVCGYVIRTESIPATGSSSSGSNDGSSLTAGYSINVPSRITGGTVTVQPASASAGSKVTITAKPNSGYEVGTITVTDKNGKQAAVTDAGNGKYTFIMSKSKVDVNVEFIPVSDAHASPFEDMIEGEYYYDAVIWAVEKGITKGISATAFSPDAPCTRGQIVTFLWRAAGSPEVTASCPFIDVSAGSYYHDAVLWAVEQGITVGTSAKTFSPDTVCTRGQTVTFLYRYEKSPAISNGNTFTDVATDAYYFNAVRWAVDKNVTVGTSTTTFSPSATCTRGQIVTFLYRDMV